ncbi:hypothetical protein E8E95_13505 [Pseudomonas sp. BN414]|uniref:hypothetical protein n=1 Tax=Pseudomonas sp. BN414 TaxID=2567888 RepID=UPI002453D3CC|nr:hypothetical protein [Pseudomonas sp. BN414]MDH4567697.1 hypothetical protein [Pseudomonas sp. BN414]
MGSKNDKLVRLHERAPQRALEGLNRVTGLEFRHWPESLAPVVVQEDWESAEQPLQENNRALPG